ncbi:acyltransferase [Pedobacter nutrimenti]|uniref:acyltransferase n=1 Tax=Pedobacter nutrimenti TaxID=1241337 RepID=UPI00292CD1CD|nr:acyltransferase [Pedobacter nutrimenti]
MFVQFFVIPVYKRIRILKYYFLSTCENVIGNPKLNQPLLTRGQGTIEFKDNVLIGLPSSAYFFTTYAYLDARKTTSRIEIGKNVWINNNICLVSEGEGIVIEEGTLIGANFSAFDSDFHQLDPDKRIGGIPRTAAVNIGKNVFIGSNVTILKGVSIGDNTVIANGSVVTKSLPENVIAGGNPCKIIRPL